ncbi:hypothetical protein A3Q32_07735 [Alcanivorax sp. KX64203]|nr:hypothetical protein A3Q32_07735 [Alcanivorax sp. KX64203]
MGANYTAALIKLRTVAVAKCRPGPWPRRGVGVWSLGVIEKPPANRVNRARAGPGVSRETG